MSNFLLIPLGWSLLEASTVSYFSFPVHFYFYLLLIHNDLLNFEHTPRLSLFSVRKQMIALL